MTTMSAARIRSLHRRHAEAHEAVYHFTAFPNSSSCCRSVRREQERLSASRVPRQMSDSARLSAESLYGAGLAVSFSSSHTRGDAFGVLSTQFTTQGEQQPVI